MSNITKAVLACGGWSTRFLPTVKTYAKQLLPILDKPQILWIIDELVAAGVTNLCIVHRDGDESLKQFFRPDPTLNRYLADSGKQKALEGLNSLLSRVKITFLPQTLAFPYGNGSPILVAKDFIGSDPFVYLYADDLVVEDQSGSYLSSLLEVFNQSQASAVCASKKVPHQQVKLYGSLKFKANSAITNQIETVIEKPEPEDAPSDFCIWGRFVFSREIINILQSTPVARGELWLTDAVNILAQTKTVIAKPLPQGSDWITTGDPLNWLTANVTLALKDARFAQTIKNLISHS